METCLQIRTFVPFFMRFLDSNYTNDSIWMTSSGYIRRQNIKSSSYQKTYVNNESETDFS